MFTTPESLLGQLHQPQDKVAWARFVRIYTPLLYSWARRMGVPRQEAVDLLQDVFALLVEKLPEFRYDPGRSFRSWLRTVTLNRYRECLRRKPFAAVNASNSFLDDIPRPAADDGFDEKEYRQYVVRRALELMQTDFQPNTWKACWEHVVAGRPAGDVGRELGMSEGAVYVATHRVLRRLRQELDGLLD